MFDFRAVSLNFQPRMIGLGLIVLLASVCAPEVGWADDEPANAPADVADAVEEAAADEGQAAEPAAEKPKPAANPLGQIFRGIFGQKPPQKIIPQNKNNPNAPPNQMEPPAAAAANETEEEADKRTARDHIDLRAPHDREVAKALRRAERFIESAKATDQAADWRNAMDTLAHILGSAETKPTQSSNFPVIRQDNGEWTPAADIANDLLAELPTEYLNLYRANYGGQARQLLDDAVERGDAEAIGQIAFRFFHTTAGEEAHNRLGMYHADRGEFGLASRWFVRLMKSKSAITQDPRWQLKAAAVLSAVGNPLADELIEKLQEGAAPLTLGANQAVQPQEVIKQLQMASSIRPAQNNWPMLLGNSSRTGVMRGDEPLLLPRWHHPLTNFEQGVESIEMLTDDLVDLGRSPLPAFFPLAIDGKICARTLRGVTVYDAESGAELWETREGLSAERILSGVRMTDPFNGPNGFGMAQQGMVFPTSSAGYYNGYNAEQDKLTNLLFRNGTWGVISSDTERMYVIEDHAILSQYLPGNTWAFRNGNKDPYNRDFSSNKISAYDLNSGRLEWEIGGQATDEPFDRRLAGWYFSGVPTPDGNRLLVMGEKDNEIWLFALEPKTGRPQWSQLLAFADTEISHDFGRRWWNAQPSVKDGVIVCPTTIGWLVGVDQTQHSILWSHRYDPPQSHDHHHHSRDEGYVVQSTPLNGRWAPSAPVVSGRHVVFTAPETQQVVCLDLFTGKPKWQRNREQDLYLAGVFDSQAVFVGQSRMWAQDVSTGKTLWSAAYSEDDEDDNELMRPSGQGVAVDGTYHLPLLSRQLLSVELATGKIESRLFLPDDHPTLGNLLMHRGLLVSVGPHGITAFEQRDAVQLAIQTRLKADANDPWALLRQGEIELLHHNHAAAWELLRKVSADELGEADRKRWTGATVAAVSHLIRQNLEGADTEFAALEKLAENHPDNQRLVQQLAAERFRARGDVASAFDAYLKLADNTDDELVPRSDDRDVYVKLSQWLAGRLAMLWKESAEADQDQLNELIRAQAESLWQSDADDPQTWSRAEDFLDLFGFHPIAHEVQVKLASRYADRGQWGIAELHLRQLTQNEDDTISQSAFAQLATCFEQAGLPEDAAAVRQQARRRFPSNAADEPTTPEPTQAFNVPVSWSDQSVSLEMMSSYYSSSENTRVLNSPPYRMPYLQHSRWEFQYQYQQVVQKSLRDGAVEWIVPLKMQHGAPHQSMISSEVVGSILFLVHGDVVHALSPLEKRILWTHALDLRGNSSSRRSVNRTSMQAMQTGSSFTNSSAVRQRAYSGGMLAVANSKYVCVYGRRSISVLDALTGEVRWMRDRVPSRSVVYGTDDVVLLVPQNMTEVQAYLVSDGRKIDLKNASAIVQKLIHTTGRHLILSERRSSASLLGLSDAKASIRAIDPETMKVGWQRSFPTSTYFSTTEDGYLAAVQATGDLSMIDMETGFVQKFESFPANWLQNLTERFLLVDSHQVYLFLNERSRNHTYFSSQLKQFRMNGRFIVFDRQTGKRKWDAEVRDTVCIVEELANLPLLMFFSAKYQQKGNFGYYSTSLTVYDKHTGWKVADHDWATNSAGFRSMEVDLKDKRIELVTYNMRIQMQAKPRPPAKAEDVSTGE